MKSRGHKRLNVCFRVYNIGGLGIAESKHAALEGQQQMASRDDSKKNMFFLVVFFRE